MRILTKHRLRMASGGLLAAVAAAATLTGCGGDDAETAAERGGTPTIRVPYTPGFGTLPVHVADVKGFFRKNGISVKLSEGIQLPTYLQALGRQYDIVLATPAGLIAAADKGLDAVAVSHVQTVDDEHENQVLVSKEPVGSVAELEGKRVGVPTLTGTSALAVLYLAKQEGVDPKRIRLEQADFASMADQLKAGRLDALVSAIPFYSALAEQGYVVGEDMVVQAVKLASGGKATTAIGGLFASSKAFVEQQPEAVKAWRASLREANEWIAANDAEARELLVSWLNVPESVARTAPLPGFEVDITAEDLAPFVEISRSVGGVEGDVSARDLVWSGASG